LFSRNNLFGLVTLSAFLAGCASPAPPLPPDTTSVDRVRTDTLADFSTADRALTCLDISAEKAETKDEINIAQGLIYSNQAPNEATLELLGPAFVVLPGLLPVRENERERADISADYARLDILIRLGKVKACKVSPELERKEMAQQGDPFGIGVDAHGAP